LRAAVAALRRAPCAGAVSGGDLGVLGDDAGPPAARVRRVALRALGRPEALPAGLGGHAAGRARALCAALRALRAAPRRRVRRRLRTAHVPLARASPSLALMRCVWVGAT